MSLIARILLLIGLTFAAITGVGVYEQITARWKSEAELKDEALRLAYAIGADQDRITEGARQLLLALSMLPSVAERDSTQCSPYFIEIKQQLAMYEFLGAAGVDGAVFCSSSFGPGRTEINVPPEVNVTDETSPALYINSYGISVASHQPVLRIAYPLKDERGDTTGHMFAGLSLRWLNERLADRHLPERAALVIADRNGIIIESNLNADFIGHAIAPALMAQLHAAKPGTIEVVDPDGLRRLYGFIGVEGLPGESIFVAAGLDAEAAAAELSRSLWQNITLLAAILLTAGLAAWIYVRRFIRAPLETLLETAHRWRAGDGAARAVRNPQVTEVDRLATAFNAAADAIEARERQLSEAKRAAELLGDSFRLLFESNPVPLWVFDRETLRFLRVNDAALAQYGYTRKQMLALTVRDVMAPDERKYLDQTLAADRRDLVKVGIRQHIRADGSRIFVNITRHELLLDGRRTVLVTGFDVTDAVRAETQLQEAANELRRSREHLAIAQRISATGSVERNLRTNEVEWSDEARRIFGVGDDLRASRRETFLAMIHADDRDRFFKFMALSDRGITPPPFDFRIIRPDGQERIIHRDTTILADENGIPSRMIGSVKDVTDQRAAEARLQETANNLRRSREHLAIAQRVSGTGSIERNLRTGEVEWSEETKRMFGVGKDPGATKRREVFLQLMHPEDRDKFVEAVAQTDRGIAPPPMEFRIIRPDGEQRIIHRDTTILFDEDGTPARMVASLRDITEQRGAEIRLQDTTNNLRRSREHLAIAQRVSGTGSIERDLRTGEVQWSDEARRIFLGEVDPAGAKTQTFLELIHPEDRDKVAGFVAQINRGVTPPPFEFRVIRPDGRERIVHRETTILFDEDGTPARAVGSLRDITDLRAAEERQRELERQLQHSQKLESLGTLAGGIAHDLNNTLVPILALAKITLRQMAEGSRGRANLDTIFRASERARDLVQQILAFSRKQELTRQAVDLLALTRETLQMLRAGLPATIDIAEQIEAVPAILGDPGQLQQVLVNLMTNAAQAIGNRVGTITVALTAVADARLDRSGRTTESAVCLRITDTGCGMDKETLDRIFEPFFTTKPVGEGTGLGLAVVHGIVTSHGGRITARSRPGEGSEFTILLPTQAELVAEDRLSMAG